MLTDIAPLTHLIGNESVPHSGESFDSVNPTHPNQVVAKVPLGGPEVATQAVDAAAEALKKWSALAGPARAEYLYKWADAIAARTDELANAIVREVGKPIGEAKGEVGRCTMILRYFAGDAVREVGTVIPGQAPGVLQYTLRTPLGVVALITPWNFPLAIPLWKAAPALAAGNTVVLKPSEMSGLCASLLAQTAQDAGLPAGVFNVVFGTGPGVGTALLNDERVRGVSFTGSDTVGAIVAETCARRNIKYQTEMGGKNIGIVLKDADLTQAANLVAGGAMRFAGQKCTATSRVVVDRSVRPAFQQALIEAIGALPFGDPANPSTAIGPVISSRSHEFLTRTLEEADAERLYQGSLSGSDLNEGYFVPPTLFSVQDFSAELAQKELFGPVLALAEASDLDHAIELANNTRFGLSAALYTKDIASAMSYIGRIEAGMVRVNGDTTGVDPHAPFGGFKGSSSHVREQGPAAREFYTEVKTVQINP